MWYLCSLSGTDMLIEILLAKLHNVRVTQTELNYTGSITIDMDLVDACGMRPNQKVLVVNNHNGERFETYIIPGDELIVMTFGMMTPEEADQHVPRNIFPDRQNRLA
jgi:aspartate 1-decarboxylase